MFRQGDILIDPIPHLTAPLGDEVPHENGRVILAHGEVTGHAHALPISAARLYLVPDSGDRVLHVTQPTALQHEEHAAIPLAPGLYLVRRQREYTPEEVRNVED